MMNWKVPFLAASLCLTLTSPAELCRIVDYGADMGSGYYRDTPLTAQPGVAVDVDGDGQTVDDSVAFWEFSLTEPMNPRARGNEYDLEATNARFYGGYTGYFAATGGTLTEGLLNENHEQRDDWNMMTSSTSKPPVKAFGLWFWQKEDFLNGGDAYTVTFDENSRIVPHISRYFDNVDSGRWVVRDGEQFYVSEKRFADYQAEIGRSSPRHTSYILHPTTTNWAPYNPVEPYQIDFYGSEATFAPHTFADVTAVGFMVYAETLRQEDLGVKWHSFEVYAQVARPAAASFLADMVAVPSGTWQGQSVASFDMGATEVPYSLWKQIYKWAVSNQYAFDLDPGYVFDRDGDMGSMDLGNFSHTAAEPATDMTWMDAVLWCNALSEYEGYTPCYYADAAKTEVLRTVVDRTYPANYNTEFEVYVDWEADGFRLPTLTEWGHAAEAGTGSASAATTHAWTAANAGGRTAEVGTLTPNAWGLYDMIGNVWEFTWDVPAAGDYFDPSTQNSHTVLGGGFLYPENRDTTSILPHGDKPFDLGSCGIGFRIVRSGQVAPPAVQTAGALPAWTFTQGQVIAGTASTIPGLVGSKLSDRIDGAYTYGQPGDPDYEDDNVGYIRGDDALVRITPYYMSKHEITHGDWKEVLQWAVLNGYTFDRDGDLGSMDWQTGQHTHTQDEPVMDVGWNDAALWCNALSEYEGLDPVYYSDEERTQVLRGANRWRISMDMRPGSTQATAEQFMPIYARWEKNGYRLPTESEWEAAFRAGDSTKNLQYPWTGGEPEAVNHGWFMANSGGKSQPVGTKPSNSYGIYDLAGNALEWVWDWPSFDYYKSHNPKGSSNPSGLFGKALRGGSFGGVPYKVTERDQDRESAARAHIGFRVVRCDAGEHPEDTTFVPEVVLDLDAANFDNHQGRMFRYNNNRTGTTAATGVPEGPVSTKWVFNTGAPVLTSPVVVDGVLYCGSDNGKVYAIDPATGAEIWNFPTGASSIVSAPAVVNNVVYIGAGNYLWAIEATSGTELWKFNSGFSTTTSPAVAYDIVWFGHAGWSNSYYRGLDAATGTEVWRFRFGYSNNGPMGPAIDGTTMYAPYADNRYMAADLRTEYPEWAFTGHRSKACMAIVDENRVLYMQNKLLVCVNRATGGFLWTFNVDGNFDDQPESSPAVGMLNISGEVKTVAFVGSLANGFYAVDVDTGSMVWSHMTGGPVRSSPTLASGRSYVGSDDGNLYAFDANDGTVKWTFDAGGMVASSPWVEDGVVFVGSSDGNIYAVHAEDSAPVILTTSLPDGEANSAYAQQLIAEGGNPALVWSLASGALPDGLSLGPSGLISGTPTSEGTFGFVVRVDDSDDDFATAELSLVINPYVDTSPVITTASLPGGTAGQPYSVTLEASGGNAPLEWSVIAGTLPAGLTLSSSGVLSGIPSAQGTSVFTVQVSDNEADSDTSEYTVQVEPSPTANLYAYDDFASPTGNLDETTSGEGWATSWDVQNTAGYGVVSSPVLAFGDIFTSGNSAWGEGSYNTSGRKLDVPGAFADLNNNGEIGLPGTEIWMSYLIRPESTSFNRVSLARNNNTVWWYTTPVAEVLSSGGIWTAKIMNGAGVSTGVAATTGQTHLIVWKLSFAATSTLDIYINPAELGGTPPLVPTLSLNTTDTGFLFNRFLWFPGGPPNKGYLDEIRFGATYADVTPVPPVGPSAPPVVTVIPSGGNLELRFQTVSGKLYVLQSSGDLVNWSPTGQELTGDGNEGSFTVPVPAVGAAFYRVEYP
ncbi:MAG: SUMF1/EgtB/PvdO family nonheme iron enzyme [Oceanipulchritudo sp.]